MKIRPVRLPPCAAGASPTTSTPGSLAPQPAIGRPQYGSSAKDRRFSTATSSRQATRRGQARQTETSASSAAKSRAPAASRRTSPRSRGDRRAVVRRIAGPARPGGTGLANSSPVTGCGSDVMPTPVATVSDQGPGDAVEDVVRRDAAARGGRAVRPRRPARARRAPITSARSGCMKGNARRCATDIATIWSTRGDHVSTREVCPVDLLAVVDLEVEHHRGHRRDRPGDPDERARVVQRHVDGVDGGLDIPAHRVDLRGRRWVVGQVPLGDPDRADVERLSAHRFTGVGDRMTSSVDPPPMSTTSTGSSTWPLRASSRVAPS